MKSFPRSIVWLAALLTLLVQGHLCHWFSSSGVIPLTIDNNPGNYKQMAFHFPPQGFFSTDYWLGNGVEATPLNPLTLMANLPPYLFFKVFYPLFAALSLLTAYSLFRHWRFSPVTSLVTAVIYAWQGDILSNIHAGHFAPAPLFALSPWLFLCLDRALQRQSWRYALGSGLIFGQMFTLLPDRAMLVGFLAGAFCLYRLFAKRSEFNLLKTRMALLGLSCVSAILIALPSLLNYLPQQLNNVTPAGGQSPEARFAWATQWSCPPEEILHWFVPGFLGWKSGDSDSPYWGRVGQTPGDPAAPGYMRNYSIGYGGVGTLAMIAGMVGLTLAVRSRRSLSVKRDKTKLELGYFFAGAYLVCFILALGRFTPLYKYLLFLPGMESWRNPIKWLVPGTLAFHYLIALGITQIHRLLHRMRNESIARPLPVTIFGWSIIMGLALWPMLWLMQPVAHIIFQRCGYNAEESIGIATTTVGAWSTTFILLSAGWLLTIQAPQHNKWHRFISELPNPWLRRKLLRLVTKQVMAMTVLGGLLLLHVFQLRSIHKHYVIALNYSTSHSETALTRHLKDASHGRVKFAANDPWMHYWLTSVFPQLGIPTLDIPAASRIPNDYQKWFAAVGENPKRMFELAGVRYILAPSTAMPEVINQLKLNPSAPPKVTFYKATQANESAEAPDARDATHAIAEFPLGLDKVTFVPEAEVITDENNLFERLKAEDWNPRRSVLLGEEVDSIPASGPLSLVPKVTLKEYNQRKMAVSVTAPKPGYLLINDRYDSAWKAKLDGQTARVMRANGIQSAIRVDGGTHELLLTYKTSTYSHWIHLIFGFAALALLLLKRSSPIKS